MKNYSLKEISQWQKEVSGGETKISLPSLQRGFVWKPNQIEVLWDSIFRGYPIGAILMSLDEKLNRNLLDGQQRCTSIALGHFNPFNDNLDSFFSLKTYKPSIWLDLAPKQSVNGQKFIFRCLTQSHPWGYQLRDSNATLSMVDRRKALKYFNDSDEVKEQKIERYTDLKSKNITPWDSYYPIPLAYILEINTDNETDFKKILSNKIVSLKIKTKHSDDEYVNYTKITDQEFSTIYKGFCNYTKLNIPEIIVDSNVLKDDDEKLNSESEDPTLFVRLNSAGTRISGEELNYSIYKAHFPEFKDLVEKIGASYLAPSKVISLFSRLSACEQNDYINYQKDFSIQIFRKKISEVVFKNILQENIKIYAKNIIEQAILILQNNDSSFPIILLKQIILSNTDLFFVLLAYLRKYGLNNLDEIEQKKIASSYVYILWFNKDSKKAASLLFNLLFTKDENISWSDSMKVLIEKDLLLPIIEPILLRKQLEIIIIQNQIQFDHITTIKDKDLFLEDIKNQLFYDSSNENRFIENWNMLIRKIYSNKSMLLYAQREYMNTKFKEFNQFESIEDTNRPWDWDHIYPDSWVYRKEGINQMVRNWVNCIGNFRALSYDDNRSENNHLSPKERFENDSKKEESFINQNDLEFWNKIDQTFGKIKHKEPEKTEIFLNAVIYRMVNIYENWLENYFNIK